MIPINANSFSHQAAVYAYSSYFYFGGMNKGGGSSNKVSTIARLDGSSYKWSKVGQLNEGRYGHNAIHLNGHFLVVGGAGTYKTEKCEYKNNQMVCHSQSPSLTKYAYTPELMIVSDDYCNWSSGINNRFYSVSFICNYSCLDEKYQPIAAFSMQHRVFCALFVTPIYFRFLSFYTSKIAELRLGYGLTSFNPLARKCVNCHTLRRFWLIFTVIYNCTCVEATVRNRLSERVKAYNSTFRI